MIRFLFIALLSFTQSGRGLPGPLAPPGAQGGLSIEARLVSEQKTFRLSEVIPLEIVFRASRAATFSIELADGWNVAPEQDRFIVEPSAGVIDRIWPYRGLICCDSRRVFLGSTPAVYHHALTDFIRFAAPGEYRIQYATRRVFTGPLQRAYKPSDLTMRSNILTLMIVEDDPGWLKGALQGALKDLARPPARAEMSALLQPPPVGSLHRPLPRAGVGRYLDAVRRLKLLDTPEAIIERLDRLHMPTIAEWRASEEARGNGYQGIDQSMLLASTRPDLIAKMIAERAAAPAFAVMRGYFELWVNVVVERDHPEMLRLRGENELRDEDKYRQWYRRAGGEVLDTLRLLNANKTGVAAEVTAVTIRSVERDRAK